MLLPLLLNNMMSVAGIAVTPPDIPIPPIQQASVIDADGYKKAQAAVRKRREQEVLLFIQAYIRWVDF